VRFCKKRKGTLIRFWLGRAHQDVQTQPQRTDTNALVRLRQVKACGGIVHEEHHDGTEANVLTTGAAFNQCISRIDKGQIVATSLIRQRACFHGDF
jgi:hypothetical protein